MNTEETPYELIDKYLQKALSQDHAFSKLAENDPQLANEVAIQKLLHDAIIDQRLRQVQSELIRHHDDLRKSSSIRKKSITAAAALLVISGGLSIIYLSDDPKKQLSTNAIAPAINAEKPIILKDSSVTASSEVMPASAFPSQKSQKTIPEKPTPSILFKEEPLTLAPVHAKSEHFNEQQLSVEKVSPVQKIVTQSTEQAGPDLITPAPEKVAETLVPVRTHAEPVQVAFDPTVETWNVPFNSEKAGKLTVLDKKGQPVLSRTFQKADTFVWNGTSTDGALLLPGLYVFVIDYSDGTVQHGYVTLTY